MKHARQLRADLRVDVNSLEIGYVVDEDVAGTVSATWGRESAAFLDSIAPALGLPVAVFLGSLCRAERIELGFPVAPEAIEAVLPLAEMLYDIRCWKDGADLQLPPEIRAKEGTYVPVAHAPKERRACLLFSGGKDSTLSLRLLQRNGYDVRSLHVPANPAAAEPELLAAQRIADLVNLRLSVLEYAFTNLDRLSGEYAETWNTFPHYNSVPFGRDMLLAVLAMPSVITTEAGFLSIGHDHNCRIAHVTYQGKRIPRNDVESNVGALALERYLTRFVASEIRLLPPVAGLSELRILHEMLTVYPQLMSMTSFCFWGSNCGRCAKCLRYYLAARVLGRDGLLRFRANPLMDGACPELDDYFSANWSADALFSDEVAYCMARLVERGDVRGAESALARFAREQYDRLSHELDDREVALMRIHSDPQVPDDFAVP